MNICPVYVSKQPKTQKKASISAVDPRHLKGKVADKDFLNCSYVINRIFQYPMLVM